MITITDDTIVLTPPVVGMLPIDDPTGNPIPCPIDFVTTTFDMTGFGGTATETFANGDALAAFVTAADAPNVWFYDSASCTLQSYTTGSPTGPPITATPPAVAVFDFEEIDDMIQAWDVKGRQVIIEAFIISASVEIIRQFGYITGKRSLLFVRHEAFPLRDHASQLFEFAL